MPSLAVSPSKNQATMMPWQRQSVFNSAPIFKLGEPINGIYSLMYSRTRFMRRFRRCGPWADPE